MVLTGAIFGTILGFLWGLKPEVTEGANQGEELPPLALPFTLKPPYTYISSCYHIYQFILFFLCF